MSSVIWLQTQVQAEDIECPAPMKQVATDMKGEIGSQAQALLKITGIELKGAVETTAVNLFAQYPNADRIAVIQNLQYQFCIVMKNSSLPDEEKFEKILQFSDAMQKL
ncbi:MAG: hypothetical protein WBW81_02385, partial [Methylocella sp.]